jgi:hypothetical protein
VKRTRTRRRPVVTDLAWADVRERALRLFRGEQLHAETEEAIVAVFEQHPQRVVETIEDVAKRVEDGRARSGWAVTLAELRRVESSGARTASGKVERGQRVAQAEEWVRHAGLHFDREDEVVDELFGERGRLKTWTDEEALRAQLLRLWREQRPSGERVDANAKRRLGEYGALRKQLAAAKRQVALSATREEER